MRLGQARPSLFGVTMRELEGSVTKRLRANISLADAAAHLGVSKATVCLMETGAAAITADRVTGLYPPSGMRIP
mgnify:CR=1 FL=1